MAGAAGSSLRMGAPVGTSTIRAHAMCSVRSEVVQGFFPAAVRDPNEILHGANGRTYCEMLC
jgi:hypothetical protein